MKHRFYVGLLWIIFSMVTVSIFALGETFGKEIDDFFGELQVL